MPTAKQAPRAKPVPPAKQVPTPKQVPPAKQVPTVKQEPTADKGRHLDEPSRQKPQAACCVEHIAVLADRLSAVVAVAPGAPLVTTPAMAARASERFPNLVRHACVNEVGDTFGAVIEHTSLPHLLEHLVIDLQTSAMPDGSAAVFVGTTTWIDEEAGRARIEVSFTDDLVALRAFRDALCFLNDVVVL